jgi:hypothetical protein
MSTQELLTFLFNAIALGFLTIAVIDFGTRAVAVYKQVFSTSNSSKSATLQPINQLPLVAIPQVLSQLPDPWLLPVENKVNISTKTFPREQKHLHLLPQAKETSMVVAPKLEDLLTGIDLDKLKLRQTRRIAKVLGIAQKVNGRDQKLNFLVSQIKLKLQKETLLPLKSTDACKQPRLARVS